MRFSWIIYLTDLPTGRFYIYNPASLSLFFSSSLSLPLSVFRHIQSVSGRRTGVSYRWPINAGVWKHDIYIRVYTCGLSTRIGLENARAAFDCDGISQLRFSMLPQKRELLADGITSAKALYYVNCKSGMLTQSDYQLTFMRPYA